MWSYIKGVAKATTEFLGESELVWTFLGLGVKEYFPQISKMGYEKRPKFLFLKYPEWYALPILSTPTQAEVKIEQHEARRAGTHLDLRIKIGGKCYDYAIVKTTELPQQTGKIQKVVRRHNHSLQYFNTDSHTFGAGEYGEGKMWTRWRGKADITVCNPEKIEFEIFDGEFKGRYCIFTEKSSTLPETILRMSDVKVDHEPRRPFTDSPVALSKAQKEGWVCEEKIDGANYTLVPGQKYNVLYSRRLSVDGKIIDRSPNIPQLRYMKFPQEYHGRKIHVEVVANNGHSSETSGLLNSSPFKSRSSQINNKPLVCYIWDMEGKGSYTERRKEYINFSKGSPRIDNRSWGDLRDRFFFKRISNPRLIKYTCGSDLHNMQSEDYSKMIIEREDEGVVYKDPNGLYNEGVFVKEKKHNPVDLRIIGFEAGKEEGRLNQTMGTMICEDENGNQVRVGTGFTDEQRIHYWNNQTDKVGKVVKVEVMEQTHTGGYRAPRFKEEHMDK